MRRAVCFFGLLTSLGAVAAPVPPPSEKELIAKHWGKTEGQGEFELSGKQLTIRSTFNRPPNDLRFGEQSTTTPRAIRTVAGDFEMSVQVLDATPPRPDEKHTWVYPMTRAGLYVAGDGYSAELHLQQHCPKQNGTIEAQVQRNVWLDVWHPRGGTGQSLKAAESGKTVHLRIARKDKAVSVSYSFDGKEWSAPLVPRQALELPDEVTVGVFLSHSTHQTVHATFDQLTVVKPKVEAGKEK